MPVSNAILERCFSTMAVVKTNWRNRLGEKETEVLLRLKREGPKTFTTEAKTLILKAMELYIYIVTSEKRHFYSIEFPWQYSVAM